MAEESMLSAPSGLVDYGFDKHLRIKKYRREGNPFTDGGLSGGTLERPALQRLLAEIDAGRIAMVVVYNIDRLTRSLADFERLDAKDCSFVSVTQAFNTSTSMGRLTLNVLLDGTAGAEAAGRGQGEGEFPCG